MLASWSEGPAKRAIVDFLATATTPGTGFVAVADRIAAFDNDGTLWVEQPLPPQFDFVFRTWEQEVKDAPSLAARQPYKALVEQDQAFFERAGTQDPEVVATLLEPSAARGPARRPRTSTRRSASGRRRSSSRSWLA